MMVAGFFSLWPLAASAFGPDPIPNIPRRADGELPVAEVECLATEMHVEAGSQSQHAKAAVGQYVLARALLVNRTVCDYLRESHVVTAMRTSTPGSWAYAVFHEDNLWLRQGGRESLDIAQQVMDFDLPLWGFSFDHFARCDVEVSWTRIYVRYRFEPQDTECFWGAPGLDAPTDPD